MPLMPPGENQLAGIPKDTLLNQMWQLKMLHYLHCCRERQNIHACSESEQQNLSLNRTTSRSLIGPQACVLVGDAQSCLSMVFHGRKTICRHDFFWVVVMTGNPSSLVLPLLVLLNFCDHTARPLFCPYTCCLPFIVGSTPSVNHLTWSTGTMVINGQHFKCSKSTPIRFF